MKPQAVMSIAYLNITALLRSPVWVLAQLSTPLGIVLVIYLLAGVHVLPYVVIGALVSGVIQSCAGLIRLVVLLKLIELQDMFVASPITPYEYMVGLSLSRLIGALPSIIVFVAVLFVLIKPTLPEILLTVAVIILTWILFSLLSFAIALNIRNPIHADPIVMVLSTVMVLLPPVYYPLWVLPQPLQVLCLLIPTTYPAEILRRALLLKTDYYFLLAIVLVYYLALAIIIAKKLKWGLHEAS